MTIQYNILSIDGEGFVTVYLSDGSDPLIARDDHPNYDAIVAKVLHDDEDGLRDLFDVSRAVAERFRQLSERVTVAHGTVFFDGDTVHSSIASHIVRFLDDGVEDWQPLVAFLEKVQANPNEHSRTQLYDWLAARPFAITSLGDIVGYKGVERNGDVLLSVHSGSAIVDGVLVRGRIPNAVGSVVEMPRSSVAHDPSAACSTGLHVGTYDYARKWAHGAQLTVVVNPRDVVSVPTDASGQKVRVCRYLVADITESEHTNVVYDWVTSDDELDDAPADLDDEDYDEENDDEAFEEAFDAAAATAEQQAPRARRSYW